MRRMQYWLIGPGRRCDYDADELIDRLEQVHTEVVIPSKKNRLVERLIDENLYKDRNKRGRPSGGTLFQ